MHNEDVEEVANTEDVIKVDVDVVVDVCGGDVDDEQKAREVIPREISYTQSKQNKPQLPSATYLRQILWLRSGFSRFAPSIRRNGQRERHVPRHLREDNERVSSRRPLHRKINPSTRRYPEGH